MRIVRLAGQNLPIEFLGLRQPARLVALKPALQRLIDRALIHPRLFSPLVTTKSRSDDAAKPPAHFRPFFEDGLVAAADRRMRRRQARAIGTR